MERNLLNDIFKIYKIEENMVNKNVVKCIFRAMKKKQVIIYNWSVLQL